MYRFGWDDLVPEVFIGDEGERGEGTSEFNAPQSIATDGVGNIYVADRGNGRISVFRPDGKPLAQIPVKRPQRLEVHRKTGAIYVMSGAGRFVRLIKLDGHKRAREVARMNLPSVGLMALDDSAEPAVIWLSLRTRTRSSLQRGEDKGDGFGEMTYPLAAGSRQRGPRSIGAGLDMSLDRQNGWLYVSNYWRHRPADGRWEVLPRPRGWVRGWPNSSPDSTTGAAGLDGNYYMNFGYRGAVVTRFGPGLKPHPYPIQTQVPVYLRHGRGPVHNKTGVIKGGSNVHGQGMMADAKGNLYALWRKQKADPGDYHRATALHVYDSRGQCIKEKLVNSSIPGLFSVRVDFAGNLYLAAGLRRGDSRIPEGLKGQIPETREDPEADAGINGYPLIYGSILKFGPEGGRIAEEAGGVKCNYGHGRAIEVKGAKWIFSEASTVLSWATPKRAAGTLNICLCDPTNFDVDGFGRSFFSDAGRCRVGVLDTNGNLVCWFGEYGNADSSMAGSKGEIGLCWPQAVAVGDRAAYVSDRLNRRIVAVRLSYDKEAVCPIKP